MRVTSVAVPPAAAGTPQAGGIVAGPSTVPVSLQSTGGYGYHSGTTTGAGGGVA